MNESTTHTADAHESARTGETPVPPPDSPTPPGLRIIRALGDEAPRPSKLPALQLDERTYDRALDCVHCGLCLPACPTYTQNGLEADSPRGRIYLMKGLADGRIDPTASVLEHLDLCLDCRACETACPSGVVYHELIEGTRAKFAEKPPKAKKKSLADRFIEAFFFHVFPYPRRLKLALVPARVMQKLGLWKFAAKVASRLPGGLSKMQQMLPATGPVWQGKLNDFYPANKANCPQGKPRATVALLAGCVGSVLFQHVNRQTVELLQHAGCDVLVPPRQQCCGAIHHHGGRESKARSFARANIDAFVGSAASAYASPTPHVSRRPDYIVTNIAGCGAALKEYAHLLRDDAQYAEAARQFTDRVRDVSEVLVALQPPRPTRSVDMTVTYHDACHLAHGQRVVDPPRQLLSWIPGLNVVPLPESDMCCGAAGTYNLSQPEMAMQLAERKICHIASTGATVCVTGNVGCAMQIQSEAARLGVDLRVTHPVTLLHQACFGDGEGASRARLV